MTMDDTSKNWDDPVYPADWNDPAWKEGGRVHNWHNHVPSHIRAMWGDFTARQKSALAAWADELAGNEQWE